MCCRARPRPGEPQDAISAKIQAVADSAIVDFLPGAVVLNAGAPDSDTVNRIAMTRGPDSIKLS